MKTYIKIYGPPYLEAIRALEGIAIDMPEVCVMSSMLLHGNPLLDSIDWIYNYFKNLGEIEYERCDKIISESGQTLGEYDFFYEWFQEPSMEQLENLFNRIDEALKPLGTRYTVINKE
jgi:hypothetical protein